MNKSTYYILLIWVATLVFLTGCSSDEGSSSVSDTKVVSDKPLTSNPSVENMDEIELVDGVGLDKKAFDLIDEESRMPEVNTDELEVTESADDELYSSDSEFSPQVKKAIDIMDGVAPEPDTAPELKDEYKKVAAELEKQITNY